MTKIKNTPIPNAAKHVEKKEVLLIANANAKCKRHFGRQAISYKTEHTPIMNPVIIILDICFNELKTYAHIKAWK